MPPCRSERATAADPRHENARKRTIVLKVGDEDEPWSLVLSMCIACSSTEGVLHSNHSTTIIDRTDKLGLSGLSRNGPVLLQPAAGDLSCSSRSLWLTNVCDKRQKQRQMLSTTFAS